MPKSRVRTKSPYTPPPTRSSSKQVSPPWLAPAMIGFLLLGLAWLVVYYVTNGELPIRAIQAGNLAVGFGLMIIGGGLATQWR